MTREECRCGWCGLPILNAAGDSHGAHLPGLPRCFHYLACYRAWEEERSGVGLWPPHGAPPERATERAEQWA